MYWPGGMLYLLLGEFSSKGSLRTISIPSPAVFPVSSWLAFATIYLSDAKQNNGQIHGHGQRQGHGYGRGHAIAPARRTAAQGDLRDRKSGQH